MTIVRFTYNYGRDDMMPMPQERVLVSSPKELRKFFDHKPAYWHKEIKKSIAKYGPLLINEQGGFMGLDHAIELSRREVN